MKKTIIRTMTWCILTPLILHLILWTTIEIARSHPRSEAAMWYLALEWPLLCLHDANLLPNSWKSIGRVNSQPCWGLLFAGSICYGVLGAILGVVVGPIIYKLKTRIPKAMEMQPLASGPHVHSNEEL